VGEAHWLEVSLTVNGELAEAVAEVLSRFVSGGVVTESGVIYNDAEDEGTEYGPVRVFGYLVVDEHLEDNRRQLAEALWHLSMIRPLPEPTFRSIEDEDWMAAWKQHYHPIPIGKKLEVLPAWIEKHDETRIAVHIDPSMAFGTGTHPSTQLCLEMVESYTMPGQPAIDVGCGSGILAIAALRLGASHALAVDIDNASIKSTNENAAANQVQQNLECALGSVTEILQGKFSLRQAPLVLVNILAPVIIRLFDAGLADLVAPVGMLVLSGILAEQAEDVKTAAKQHSLHFKEMRQIEDWVALAFSA
jgi:ribosomal protein L11 methyltransferase